MTSTRDLVTAVAVGLFIGLLVVVLTHSAREGGRRMTAEAEAALQPVKEAQRARLTSREIHALVFLPQIRVDLTDGTHFLEPEVRPHLILATRVTPVFARETQFVGSAR